jgi:hypothetical protein
MTEAAVGVEVKAALPNATLLDFVQVMTPVETTMEQSPLIVKPPKEVPAMLYSI